MEPAERLVAVGGDSQVNIHIKQATGQACFPGEVIHEARFVGDAVNYSKVVVVIGTGTLVVCVVVVEKVLANASHIRHYKSVVGSLQKLQEVVLQADLETYGVYSTVLITTKPKIDVPKESDLCSETLWPGPSTASLP
ncbi:hypothetical protein QBC40DRAFT_299839 [Triangularia verruculosa]|uniref:Uncharacterized protein n=1 Tax=Triangularia verruculosa TaxID=2587418 RepID=A0AAN6XAW1_9PEZI|nr:hypothetical protein QBC40DRAFT_299839 [Triangularia verruculosa]